MLEFLQEQFPDFTWQESTPGSNQIAQFYGEYRFHQFHVSVSPSLGKGVITTFTLSTCLKKSFITLSTAVYNSVTEEEILGFKEAVAKLI